MMVLHHHGCIINILHSIIAVQVTLVGVIMIAWVSRHHRVISGILTGVLESVNRIVIRRVVVVVVVVAVAAALRCRVEDLYQEHGLYYMPHWMHAVVHMSHMQSINVKHWCS